MDPWIPDRDFIAADVIRWTEGVFNNRRRGKALRIGERVVIAEVAHRGKDGWLSLVVRACTVTKDEMAGMHVPALKPDTTIKRSLKTVLRGKVERLPWSDETARTGVVASETKRSSFLADFLSFWHGRTR